MSKTIPHRELRNRSSEVLRDVQDGETFEITNHGEVVAVLAPPTGRPREALRVRRATHEGGFSSIPRVRLDHPAQQALDDLRGER